MPKNMHRDKRSNNKEDIMPPQKEHRNCSVLECEDGEVNKIPEMNGKKIAQDCKKITKKQIIGKKKFIHEMDVRFCEEIAILKNQTEILEMKNSTGQTGKT